MKATRFSTALLLTLLLATLVVAQQSTESSDPKDLVVLEHNWRKDFVGQRGYSNPLEPNEEHIRLTRAEKNVIREREEFALPNQTTQPPMPVPRPRPIGSATRPTDIYVYEFKVRNTGAKKIKAIGWEYQFLHPMTQQVMASRRIVSKVKLSPGKTSDIKASLLQKPTTVVAADQLDKKLRDQFKERLIIHRIEYADGSVWQRTP